MGSAVLPLCVIAVLFSAVLGGHDHHNNHKDFQWQDLVSYIAMTLKNKTDVLTTVESVSERTDKIKDSHHFESTPEQPQNSELSTENTSSTAILQMGDYRGNDRVVITGYDGHDVYYRPNYALIISLPIVGLVILIGCCIAICRCCNANRNRQGMVLLQPPNAIHPPPISTQIIVQQPNYPQGQTNYPQAQPPPPPPYQMQQPVQNYEHQQQQQWSQQQPPQQWAQPQAQEPQYPKQAYENPTFNATAPPPYPPDKY